MAYLVHLWVRRLPRCVLLRTMYDPLPEKGHHPYTACTLSRGSTPRALRQACGANDGARLRLNELVAEDNH